MERYEEYHYKIKVIFVDYCVEEEDFPDLDEDEVYEAIIKTKEKLPQEMVFEFDCEEEVLKDLICDAITEKTGWLIYSFDYLILEKLFIG